MEDVRNKPLSSKHVIFQSQDLAVRYGQSPATISRWNRDGYLPPRDVYSAEGNPKAWSSTALALFEQENPEYAQMAAHVALGLGLLR